jgi:MraZ protein
MLFVGKVDYQLDDRKRIPIPPLYRGAFDTGGYLSTGNDPCIVLHTLESFQKTAEIIEAIPAETEEGDDSRRDFYGNVWVAQKDAQGRITLRDDFIEHAGLSRDVLVVGVGDKLEIWDKATYLAREAEQKENRRRATARRNGAGAGEA